MDHTLALIILPMLIQLKQNKHGVPNEVVVDVGGEDYVSQQSFDFYTETHKESFDKACKRWDDILDKMIWSFEQVLNDDWDEQFWIIKPEIDWDDLTSKEGCDKNGCKEVKWLVKGECDWEGRKRHADRIQEGLELFGKYYQDLWD